MKKKYVHLSEESIFNSALFASLTYFINQGMRYMEPAERIYKFSISVLIFYFLTYDFGILGFLLAHFINMVVNGQIFVLTRYTSIKNSLNEQKIDAVFRLIGLFYRAGFYKDVLITGSGCRNKLRSSSDLDLRLYYNPKYMGIFAFLAASVIRFYSLLILCPLDLYCFNNPQFLTKLDKDEQPISVFKYDKIVENKYRKIQDRNFTNKVYRNAREKKC